MSILDRLRPTSDDAKSETTPVTPTSSKSNASTIQNVLIRPIVTEKASMLNAHNQYVFEVKRTANKIMVAEAVQKQFGVKPIAVQIVNIPAKTRVRGRIIGKINPIKKAIVTLPEGKRIGAAEVK